MPKTAVQSLSTSPAAGLNGTHANPQQDADVHEHNPSSFNPEEAFQLLQSVGAILDGHFEYESKRHGNIYVEKFRLLEHRRTVETLGKAIASAFSSLEVSLVAGPTTGGWLLAYATAGAFSDSTRVFCAEPAAEGGREFRRGFTFKAGDRVLVVDDVLTTGGSIRDTLQAVRKAGAEPVAVGVIVDRTSGTATPDGKFDGLPFFSCLPIDAESYDKADCQLCADDVDLTIT